MSWVAVSYGALDLRGTPVAERAGDIAVTPIHPGDPVVLSGDVAALWLRLVDTGIDASTLRPDEADLVREFAEYGIASGDEAHPHRLVSIDQPWLTSSLHELVYALVANVADAEGIPLVFIKGPVLYAQHLRAREHSGDVDLWVEPGRQLELAHAMERWGWTMAQSVFGGTKLAHALTLVPTSWGAEIDVHWRFPGVGVDDVAAFAVIRENSEIRTFAGVDVASPRPPLHAVISALHMVRPLPGTVVAMSARQDAATLLQTAGEGSLQFARTLGSLGSLRNTVPFSFPFASAECDDAATPPDWRWRQQPTTRAAYFVALRIVPPRDRLRLLARILWPPEGAVLTPATQPGEPVESATLARIRRLGRGVRLLTTKRSSRKNR